ncbi:MAG: phosphate acyltransferase PlsX, partial [Christensenellaceae bacterium]|nr:phosphate acyltransferase PlsX [Christensenellaceae bacterium]
MYKIIVDAMGGDNAPRAIIEGCLLALGEYEDVSICLVGKKEVIAENLRELEMEYDPERLDVVDAREEIEMAEPPVNAIRKKKDSSLVVGMNMVAAGDGEVFITAGSTGATVAGATLIIRRAKGVERPALAPILPTTEGGMMLVDCGANVDCKPSYLRQFGIMGSIYMQTVMGVENPRVGLINNGAEEEKGNLQTKKAFELLRDTDINFVGNVEGRDLPLGACDVAVADGFVGNVVMKFMEGCAKAIMTMLKDELMSSAVTKMGAALCKPAFARF